MKIFYPLFLATFCLLPTASFVANKFEEEQEAGTVRPSSSRERDERLLDADGVTLKIVGGSESEENEFPFFVHGDGCGGTLIHKDLVLTAAHCKGNFEKGVIVGAYEYGSADHGAKKISVKKEVVHPDYDDNTNKYDFMILQLEEHSDKTTIKLNSNSSSPSGSELLVTIGLGAMKEDSSNDPDVLMKVQVKNIPAGTCADMYDDGDIDQATMICAASPGKDSCSGDSGGPIIRGDRVQVGVVSWGIGCAREEYPGVYARVSKAYSWIQDQMCKYSRGPPEHCKDRRYRRNLKQAAKSRRQQFLRASTSTRGTASTVDAEFQHDMTCSDSNETFDLFDSKGHDKNCAWLAENRIFEGGDLCEYTHIAFRCPSTCGDCLILTEEDSSR